MASISGILENTSSQVWVVAAYSPDTHELAAYTETESGTYTITGLVAGKAYILLAFPKMGTVWNFQRDPYWSNVNFMFHCDGTVGNFPSIDSTGKTVGYSGSNTKFSSTQKKFGETSIRLDGGSGSYLSANVGEVTGGTVDFTLEAWIYLDSATGTRPIFAKWPNGNNLRFVLDIITASTIRFRIYETNIVLKTLTAPANISLNTWHHIAFCKSGTTGYIFLNGQSLEVTGALTSQGNFSDTSTGLLIGGNVYDANYFSGYIDEIRVTSGLARYTSSFVVPDYPYLGSPSTISVGKVIHNSSNYIFKATSSVGNFLPGLSEPSWINSVESTVTDGNVVWTCLGKPKKPLAQGLIKAT